MRPKIRDVALRRYSSLPGVTDPVGIGISPDQGQGGIGPTAKYQGPHRLKQEFDGVSVWEAVSWSDKHHSACDLGGLWLRDEILDVNPVGDHQGPGAGGQLL